MEQYRLPSGLLRHRHLTQGRAVAFGPGHVHNVGHAGTGSATSIHAYSPPLLAMTYYTCVDRGLIARETIAVSPGGAPGIDELLEQARTGLRRLGPQAAFAALAEGGVLVDIRPLEQRIAEGEIPGAVIIGRNVLEWRLDPRSDARIPDLARPKAKIIVVCSEGYASILAAASLRRIGLTEATDLDGGFRAWQAAGLPTRPATVPGHRA